MFRRVLFLVLAGAAVAGGHAGLVGYSMGGYGVVNVIGGGYSKASETASGAPPNKLLADRGAANPVYQKSMDPRQGRRGGCSLGHARRFLGCGGLEGHQDSGPLRRRQRGRCGRL